MGPVTLAAFFDVGVNKIIRPSQLTMNPDRVADLNSQFPQAGFSGRAIIAKGTQKVRSSTGVELQVMMPVVNAPFRVYWAYNPLRANTVIQPPIAADRSYFPNQASYLNAMFNPSSGGTGWRGRTATRRKPSALRSGEHSEPMAPQLCVRI